MQIATVVNYEGDSKIEIPRALRDVFVIVGGEDIYVLTNYKENCIYVFFNPKYDIDKLKRLKVRGSDDKGSSSKIYNTIEESKIGIISVQGTTTGREKRAVNDLIIDFSELDLRLEDIEILLEILSNSNNCVIKKFDDYKLPSYVIQKNTTIHPATIDSTGQYIRLEIMDEWFKKSEGSQHSDIKPENPRKAIINWDTEYNFLTLTFTKKDEKLCKMILFQKASGKNTGKVGEILKNADIDFLIVQTNILGRAFNITALDTKRKDAVLKWDIIADISNALNKYDTAEKIAEELGKHDQYLFGGGIQVFNETLKTFGIVKKHVIERLFGISSEQEKDI